MTELDDLVASIGELAPMHPGLRARARRASRQCLICRAAAVWYYGYIKSFNNRLRNECLNQSY